MHRIIPGRFTITKYYLLLILAALGLITAAQIILHAPRTQVVASSQVHAQPSQVQTVASTSAPVTQPTISVPRPSAAARAIPILMYHQTPADFEAQLAALQSKGYTTIAMAQLADYFDGLVVLPAKPAVITFDDGYADQMQAFELLQRYDMKATFYLIIGGERSQGCIGITRHNLSCGDNYLSWEEIHLLANSGRIEMAAHTLNHPDLPTLSVQEQTEEIVNSKKIIEDELGAPITSLAYPYGRFNDTTVALTRQAGFRTAVTTIGGEMQSSNNRFTLLRARNALLLP